MKTRVERTSNPAGRVFQFTERSEQQMVGAMRDVDEMGVALQSLYPGNTWTRGELLQLFFLDSIDDSLRLLLDRGNEL